MGHVFLKVVSEFEFPPAVYFVCCFLTECLYHSVKTNYMEILHLNCDCERNTVKLFKVDEEVI